jgi:hypothetical protein
MMQTAAMQTAPMPTTFVILLKSCPNRNKSDAHRSYICCNSSLKGSCEMTDEYAEFRKYLPDGKPLGVLVDFSLPVAQRLSDLSGIDADLKAVARICERLEKMDFKVTDAASDPLAFLDNMQLCDALFDAAVIKFGRVQATGARTGMPSEWVAELPDAMQINYEHILNLRNKLLIL